MYSRQAALDNLTSLAHYFLNYGKLQPGGPGYEIPYGTTGVLPYLLRLGEPASSTDDSEFEKLKVAFSRIAVHEQRLMEPLIAYLISKWDAGVRIVGPASSTGRAPTISFVVVGEDGKTKRLQSKDIVAKFDSIGNVSTLEPISLYESPLRHHSDWHSLWALLRLSAHIRPRSGTERRRYSYFFSAL